MIAGRVHGLEPGGLSLRVGRSWNRIELVGCAIGAGEAVGQGAIGHGAGAAGKLVIGAMQGHSQRSLSCDSDSTRSPEANIRAPIGIRHTAHLPGLGGDIEVIVRGQLATLRIIRQQRCMQHQVAVHGVHGVNAMEVIRPVVLEAVLQVGLGLGRSKYRCGQHYAGE